MTIIPSRARRLAPRCVDGCQWNMYGEAGLSSSCHFCPSFLNYARCHYNSDPALFNTSQSNQPGHGRPRRRHASLQHTHTFICPKWQAARKGETPIYHHGHQRQTNRRKRDRQKKYRITDKQMNNDQILTETMDIDSYSYLLTTKYIKPKFI